MTTRCPIRPNRSRNHAVEMTTRLSLIVLVSSCLMTSGISEERQNSLAGLDRVRQLNTRGVASYRAGRVRGG